MGWRSALPQWDRLDGGRTYWWRAAEATSGGGAVKQVIRMVGAMPKAEWGGGETLGGTGGWAAERMLDIRWIMANSMNKKVRARDRILCHFFYEIYSIMDWIGVELA